MKKMSLTVALIAICTFVFAQANDKAYLHNGKTIEVKIIKVAEFNVTFSYPNETAEQVMSRYLVQKIDFASGRTEQITEKIVVSGKEDWEKVIVLEDKGAVVGLVKKEEVRGKTSGLMSFNTAGSADKKSMRKLKEAAAEIGCPFVYLTADKDNQFTAQSIKKAIAYNYK